MKPESLADCIICAKPFMRLNTLQTVCSVRCARQVPVVNRKAERARDRARREKLKTRSDWMGEAQRAFNTFIRIRDAGRPCICCGAPMGPNRPGGGIDAGHFLSVGSAPHLRFEESNVHAQRKSCNRPGGTTRAAFRAGMIARVGLAEVERLEADQAPRKFTVTDLREIRDKYRALAREAMSMERQGLE